MRKTAVAATFFSVLVLTASAAEIGKPSPALTIQQLQTGPAQLTQYKGKVVALALINTTCPHCQNLTKVLSAISKEYEPKGVQIVACAFNDGAQQLLPQFIKDFKPTFPVGYCDREAVMAYVQYSVASQKPFYVPHMVFLDRRGIVRGDYPGESEFMTAPDVNVRTELDKMLKATTSEAPASHKRVNTTASARP